MNDRTQGLVMTPSVAKRIAIELFDQRSEWTRADLCVAAQAVHDRDNGKPGVASISMNMKKALSIMKNEGRIYQPQTGIWRRVMDGESPAPVAVEVEDDLLGESTIDEPIYKTIGSGSEAVYVYYNASDCELATLKGQGSFPCKVGMTSKLPVHDRILTQGVKTAFSRAPIIGLVILTDNAYGLEQILHRALSYSGADLDESIGSEWFMTTPEKIADWYDRFTYTLEAL